MATAIASGALTEFIIVKAIGEGAVPATTAEIHEGNIVKAVFIEMWYSAGTADKTFEVALVKLPAGLNTPTVANLGAMTSYTNKKNVIEFHQGLGPTGGNQIAAFRHWIKIPKGKQRFGLNDELVLVTSAVGSVINVCGFATYKDYK